MRTNSIARVFLILLIAAAVGCAGTPANRLVSDAPTVLTAALPASSGAASGTAVSARDFRLNVMAESYLPGSSASYVRLLVEDKGTEVVAMADVHGAQGMKALYFDLTYDPGRYNPTGVDVPSQFGTPDQTLTLTMLDEPGRLYHGQVLILPQKQAGFTGDGMLATVHFLKQPYASSRASSQAPTTNASAAVLALNESTKMLEWGYASQGDYDQNSETNIADLTPIALHFGEVGPFDYFTVQSVVDGDSNGEINIADLTPIGLNFQRRVQKYDVFEDATVDGLPQSNDGVSSIPKFASVPFADNSGNPATDRLAFAFDITDQTDPEYFWVRPVDGTSEGTPSNYIHSDGQGQQLPVAILTATPQSGEIPLSVSFDASGSSDSDGTIVNYEWDYDGNGVFNEVSDGESAVEGSPNASHSYAQSGTYDATVRVTDNDGNTATATRSISANQPGNNPPVADLTASPLSGELPLQINFDASGSTDSDGTIVLYEWDFDGNGVFEEQTGSTPTAMHTYSVAGVFDAAVRVTDDDGSSDITSLSEMGGGTIVITMPNQPPLADITADITSGVLPLTVNFDASGSVDPDGTIVNYEWDWDGDSIYDFNSGGTPTAQHNYLLAGDYDPAVRVTDDDGASDTASLSDTVSGGLHVNAGPNAIISGNPLSGDLPLTVDFDASLSSDPDGTIVKYEWDFDGDGIYDEDTGTTPTSQNIYTTAGDFNAAVRVTDNDGATAVGTLLESAGSGIQADQPNVPPTASFTASPLSGIAPLTVSFDATASSDSDGTIVKWEWDFDNDGTYDVESLISPLSQYIFTNVGMFNTKLRVTDDDGATDTATLDEMAIQEIEIDPPPVAALTATPTSGDAPLVVSFDASGSTDDDAIVSFEWDFDGDGIYELNTGTTPTASHGYGATGTVTASVRVTDSETQTDTASVDITVTNGFDTSSIAVGNVEIDSKMSINAFAAGDDDDADNCFDGPGPFVGLAYKDASVDDLYFVDSSDGNGTTWNTPVALQTDGDVGNDCTLRKINGKPGISFKLETGVFDVAELRFIGANDGAASSWWADPVVIDAGSDSSDTTSVAYVHGRPAVSEVLGGLDTLRSVRGTNPQGDAAWNSPVDVFVGSGGQDMEFTDMLMVGDNPCILFGMVSVTGDTGLYFVSGDHDADTWDAPITLDAPAGGGRYCSLSKVNAHPAGSYEAYPSDELRYVRADDEGGSSWGSPLTVDSGSGIGQWTTLRTFNGKPVIAYYDAGNKDLKFAFGTDNDGTSWIPVVVDSVGDVGEFATMTIAGGNVVIAYYDATNQNIKIAVLQ